MVTKYKQDNDLSILLETVPGVVSVSVALWIKTGSVNETKDQYGYAHFVEHLLFKGTKNYSAKEIAQMVDRVGGQHNAATNREYTCYYINVVSEHLELAISLLADMYYNSLFDPLELQKEKKVVIEEIRMSEDAPDEYVHDLFLEKMLQNHPLAHPILGTIEGIQESNQTSLVDFYKEYYRNDNALFVMAGNFEEKRVQKLISKHFSKKTDSINFKESLELSYPQKVSNFHVERDLEQVHFCLGLEGLKRSDRYRWPLYVFNTILGGSMSSRLFQKIRENEGLCYSIYSFHSSFSDHGVFGVYSATSPDNFVRVIELVLQEARGILKNGFKDSEIEDAKTFIKGNFALSIESTEVKMVQLAKNELFFQKVCGFDEMSKRIDALTRDDLQEIIEILFKDKIFSNISIGKTNKDKIAPLNLKI